jgi:hypothetical protein
MVAEAAEDGLPIDQIVSFGCTILSLSDAEVSAQLDAIAEPRGTLH